jgi:Uma2 family endonuclease
MLERQTDFKSEYLDGQIIAMGGASESHNLIASNVLASLHLQLRQRPCRVYQSDLRVRVNPNRLYSYPDVVVVCGKAQFEDDELDTLLNPTLIVEVLSKSTEEFDRGEKFRRYRTLVSLQEYLLIAQQECRLEQYTRQPDGSWRLVEFDQLSDRVSLSSIDCHLLLADVYEKVTVGRPPTWTAPTR